MRTILGELQEFNQRRRVQCVIYLQRRDFHDCDQFIIWCLMSRERYFSHAHTRKKDRRGRVRMIVGFTTIYAINAYHH